ncbi:MAG: chemotaxis protein CheD [Rhodospirillales bacterium]
MKTIKIGPGEHYVTKRSDEKIVTVLGSCVAACIRDPVAGIGGMNHFMLPESATGVWGQASATMRYGNFAMERLINDILRGGGQRNRLEVKVFGGAAMIANGAMVGHQNAAFVESYLKAENMPIAAHHLRGESARRIDYEPRAGKVMMLEMSYDAAPIARAETKFLRNMQPEPECGSVELFD